MIKVAFLTGFGLAAILCAVGPASAASVARLSPFLERYCYDCHSKDAAKGGLNLETLSLDLDDPKVRSAWVYLHDRVANGEMPPREKLRPTEASRSQFLNDLAGLLRTADLGARETVLRRLNRNEYEYTVRDLFGIHADVQRLLPDDSSPGGFDTTGADLSLSAEQMELYLQAADLVLDEVFGPETAPRRMQKREPFRNFRQRERADRLLPDGGLMFGRRPVPLWLFSVPVKGTYRVKIRARTHNADKPQILRVSGGLTGSIQSHHAGFLSVPDGEFTTLELIDRARERGDNIQFSFMDGAPSWKVNADAYEGPGVVIAEVEVEGPLEAWPPPSRTRLLGDVDPDRGTIGDLHAIMKRVAPRAFRRPVEEVEIEPYLHLAKEAREEGKPFVTALRRGLKGLLCAPEFLFLEEGRRLTEHALASRLSYLFWSSLPDAELTTLADSGSLRGNLRAQVERMLLDGKSQRFVKSFTGQWLRLRDIDFTVPDRRLYPEYDQLLRESMLAETHSFFREVLEKDLTVQTFIDADFVMVNQPLAEFYGLAGVNGLETRRVALPKDSVRGGLLTQASVLKVSADGTRTSPVLRGVWILKHLFGTPAPPPPPSVVAVEPDIRGATTIREQLEKHRSDHSCNRCHRKIDPPGFALESFDVIGAQRDWYRTRKGKWVNQRIHAWSRQGVLYRRGPDVDSSGAMPDGRTFGDIREYKRLLLEDGSAMARSLTRLLLTYGTGRPMGFSDRAEIEQIVDDLKSKDHGFRSLIHAVTQSKIFQSP